METPVPPPDLRAGMGPFEDPDLFVRSGRETLDLARRMIDLGPADHVLDLGCGCGRVAIHLLSYLGPSGSYLGVDVDSACVSWCTSHITSRRSDLVFQHIDVRSSSYNPEGALTSQDVRLPADDAVFDTALLSSLFTHMTELGIRRYLEELCRVVKQGGRVLVSLLLMNDGASSAIARGATLFAFEEPLGEWSWTLDRSQPLDAVAVSEEWFSDAASEHRFEVTRVEYGTWRENRSWEVQHDWVSLRRLAG